MDCLRDLGWPFTSLSNAKSYIVTLGMSGRSVAKEANKSIGPHVQPATQMLAHLVVNASAPWRALIKRGNCQFGDLAAGVPLFDEPVGLTILSTDAVPTNILVDALFPSAM